MASTQTSIYNKDNIKKVKNAKDYEVHEGLCFPSLAYRLAGKPSFADRCLAEEKTKEVLRPAQKDNQNVQQPRPEFPQNLEVEASKPRVEEKFQKILTVDSQFQVFYIGAFCIWDQQALQNSKFPSFDILQFSTIL